MLKTFVTKAQAHGDFAALSAADQVQLAELDRRLSVIRDRVRGVARRHHSGLYLFGRPGTSKTHTVRESLAEAGAATYYTKGHLTPLGLFDILAEHSDQIIVLDDVSQLLTQATSLQLLLAALGDHGDIEARCVRYKRQGCEKTVLFTGGIICISNLELHPSGLLQALKSRVHYFRHDPTDTQIGALIRYISSAGWHGQGGKLTSHECSEVAEFLIAESKRLGCRLDIRHLVEKAFPDFMQFRQGDTESHWKDLVTATLKEAAIEFHYPRVTRGEQLEQERQMVGAILGEFKNPKEQLAAWKERTRGQKSTRAFYRRRNELVKD